MIIPFKNSFGNCIISNHQGSKLQPKINVFCKQFHKHGYYPVYRIVFENEIRTYYNKTLKQMSGILTRLGY